MVVARLVDSPNPGKAIALEEGSIRPSATKEERSASPPSAIETRRMRSSPPGSRETSGPWWDPRGYVLPTNASRMLCKAYVEPES